MAVKTITVLVQEDKLSALDLVAERQQRDRDSILDEAVAQYLSLQEYHRALIEEGTRQANAGEVVPHETVVREMENRISAKTSERALRQQRQ